MVLLTALDSTSEEIVAEKSLETEGTLGKSVAFSPESLYRPLSELISILYDDSSIENVTGWSGRFLSVSRRIRAGTAMLPRSFDSTVISVIIEVCKSEAVTVKLVLSISNKKFSRIGTTGFVVITPLILESCFSR